MLAECARRTGRGDLERDSQGSRRVCAQARAHKSGGARRRSRIRCRGRGTRLRPRRGPPRSHLARQSRKRGRPRSLPDAPADGQRRAVSEERQRRQADSSTAVKELEAVLVAFRDSTRCEAAVWSAKDAASPGPALLARSGHRAVAPDKLPEAGSLVPITANEGTMVVAAIPGVKRTWITISPCDGDSPPAENHLRMLAPVVAQILRGAQEVEHAALELAERYEEINLLYTIGEILGRTVTLEEAAATILTEISETVGARHASILVHEPGTEMLHVVAAIGADAKTAPPMRIDDPD